MSTGQRLYHLGQNFLHPHPPRVSFVHSTRVNALLFSLVLCKMSTPPWIWSLYLLKKLSSVSSFFCPNFLLEIALCLFYLSLDREPFLYSTGSQTPGGTNVWVEREQFNSNSSKVWKDFDKKVKSSILGLSSITLSSFILLKNVHKYCSHQ